MGTNTADYGLAIPADGDDVGGPQFGNVSNLLNDFAISMAAILGGGFLSGADLIGTPVPAQRQVTMSTGGVFVTGPAGNPVLVVKKANYTVGPADGLVGGGAGGVGTLHYIWIQPNGVWVANTTGAAPVSGSKLAATIMVDPAAIVAGTINNRPAGRVNLSEQAILARLVTSATVEAANARTVSVQLTDILGNNVPEIRAVEFWVSDTDKGAEAAAAPSGGIAFNAGTILATTTANKRYRALTNAAGLLQFTVTEAAVKTFWVVTDLGSRLFSFSLAFA